MERDDDLLRSDGITFEATIAKRRARAEDEKWRFLAKAGDIGAGLAKLLRDMGAIAPGKYEQKTIARLIGGGERISFVSVVCPDYATRDDRGAVCYTFDSLRDGIGVVAGRALEVHVRLASFFAERGMATKTSFVLAMADQEAGDENCKRVGIDREEFLARLRRSQEVLANRAEALGVKIEAPLLTSMDPSRWEASKEEAKKTLERVSPGLLGDTLRSRWPFYERWAGRRLHEEEAAAVLRAQVEEYIAVGRYLDADRRIILGLDSPLMAPFVRHGTSRTPVIYFEQPEY